MAFSVRVIAYELLRYTSPIKNWQLAIRHGSRRGATPSLRPAACSLRPNDQVVDGKGRDHIPLLGKTTGVQPGE